MLFRSDVLARIASGDITLAFRRWQRPTVRTGGTLRTAVGTLAIDDVRVVDEGDITAADIGRSGHASGLALKADLHPNGTLYRIEFHRVGADSRADLRERPVNTDAERAAVLVRLSALDQHAADGAWTARTLTLIDERPGVRAGTLAAVAGDDVVRFKRRVRQLKELGLTESLEVGYRLSRRGGSVLMRLHKPSR